MQVYLISSTATAKQYIGKTEQLLQKRFNCHKCSARQMAQTPLHRAMRKYGIDTFSIESLGRFESPHILNLAEQLLILAFDAKVPNGYNRSDGVEGPSGTTVSVKTRKLQSLARLGKKQSPETIERRVAALRGRKRPKVGPAISAAKSQPFCKRGHAMIDNLGFRKDNGYRYCAECSRIRAASNEARRREIGEKGRQEISSDGSGENAGSGTCPN